MSTKIQKLAAGVGAVTGLLSSYVYMKVNNNEKIAFASWTTNYEPNPSAKWDYNWDQ